MAGGRGDDARSPPGREFQTGPPSRAGWARPSTQTGGRASFLSSTRVQVSDQEPLLLFDQMTRRRGGLKYYMILRSTLSSRYSTWETGQDRPRKDEDMRVSRIEVVVGRRQPPMSSRRRAPRHFTPHHNHPYTYPWPRSEHGSGARPSSTRQSVRTHFLSYTT